ADDAGAAPADLPGQLPLGAGVERPVEPGRDAEEPAGALVEGLPYHLGDAGGGDAEHDEVELAGHVPHGGHALPSLDHGTPGVDEVHRPAVRALQRAPGEPVAPL